MNKQELSALVAEILSGMGQEPTVKAAGFHPTQPQPEQNAPEYSPGDFVPDVTQLDLRKLYLVEAPQKEAEFRRLKEKTPARLGSGKAGARYKTLTMLRFRADHAAAQDTVFTQVPEDFAKNHGMTEVQTKCSSKDEYLTRPDLGRCFECPEAPGSAAQKPSGADCHWGWTFLRCHYGKCHGLRGCHPGRIEAAGH